MEPIWIVTIVTAAMVALILLGVHVAVALGIMSLAGLWWITGSSQVAINLLSTTSFNALQSYEFGVIPLFVLMGAFFGHGLSAELFDAANVVMHRVRGGLAIATVLGNGIFAAITGSSMASAAAFSRISFPPMITMGYDRRFAAGCVAGSSVLGMLIPPSILFIIYGILTQASIGKLFIAGIIPGLILMLIYCIGIVTIVRARPALVGQVVEQASGAHRSKAIMLLRPWPVIVLIVAVLGGIYRGFFTPNEAAAVGTAGALVIAATKRQLTWVRLKECVVEAGLTTGSIMLLLITAQMYSRMIALSGVIQGLDHTLGTLALPGLGVLTIVVVLILLLGTIVDSASILLLVVPIAYPILTRFGYDPIWLGVVIVIATEMGLITPPFGLSVFTVKAALGNQITLPEIFSGSVPFLLMMGVTLVLIIAFPVLSIWLVQFM
jgi:tripartite ATP-independent transporter DctM subunit